MQFKFSGCDGILLRPGDIIVAGDDGCRDAYICRVLEPARNFAHTILCEVLEMTRYPIQHAIMHPELASENTPIMPEAHVYLQFIARMEGRQPGPGKSLITEQEYRQRIGSRFYWPSFDSCLAQYRAKVEHGIAWTKAHPHAPEHLRVDPAELDILDRHQKREFSGRRALLYED